MPSVWDGKSGIYQERLSAFQKALVMQKHKPFSERKVLVMEHGEQSFRACLRACVFSILFLCDHDDHDDQHGGSGM